MYAEAAKLSEGFYVYLHRRKTDNSIFYVGKGKLYRAWTKNGRSDYWHNTVNKYGYTVEILFDSLTEFEALQSEIDIIEECTYFGFNLINLTKGGQGLSGLKLSDITKKKIGDANRGLKRTEEQKSLLRGPKHTENNKKLLSERFKKSVKSSNGMIFASVGDAQKWAYSKGLSKNNTNNSCIGQVCTGKLKTLYMG